MASVINKCNNPEVNWLKLLRQSTGYKVRSTKYEVRKHFVKRVANSNVRVCLLNKYPIDSGKGVSISEVGPDAVFPYFRYVTGAIAFGSSYINIISQYNDSG